MTRDKCIYEISVKSSQTRENVKEHVVNSNYTEGFSAEIIDEDGQDGITTLTIEVSGDTDEIIIFEEGFAEIPEATVSSSDASVGNSKFD